MLKRLKHHINVKIKQLLDQMILETAIIFGLGLLFTILHALTLNTVWLGILWLCGLVYATAYFIDAIKYGSLVREIEQENQQQTIWLSKAYFN
jgi:arginine exporter protein ArgO